MAEDIPTSYIETPRPRIREGTVMGAETMVDFHASQLPYDTIDARNDATRMAQSSEFLAFKPEVPIEVREVREIAELTANIYDTRSSYALGA